MDPSLRQAIPQYYYSVTGEVVLGDNKNAKEFTSYNTSRFPINVRKGIFVQTEGWDQPFEGEPSPLFDNPGTIPSEFAVGRSTPRAANQ